MGSTWRGLAIAAPGLLTFCLVSTSVTAGPAGIVIPLQQAQTIARVQLVCENDPSITCPTTPSLLDVGATSGYCLSQSESGRIVHTVCNPGLTDCADVCDPGGSCSPASNACVPLVVGELPAALQLAATEIPAPGACSGEAPPDSSCINLELSARLDVQGPTSFFSREQTFTHPDGFWSDGCFDDFSPGGVRVSDWFPFRSGECVFDRGINFAGMILPGNVPLVSADGLSGVDPQLVSLEDGLVQFAENACGYPDGSVLPVALLDSEDAAHARAAGTTVALDPSDLRDTQIVGASRSGWYPLRVRYALTAQRRLEASDQTCSLCYFGEAVDVAGDVAIVGASGGYASVHRFDGTTWNQERLLLPSNPPVTSNFGFDVAVSGNLILVGSAGPAAATYQFDGSEWISRGDLFPPLDGALTGYVALDGDVAVLGARGSSAPELDRVFVYRFNGTSWAREATLTPSDGQPGFGKSLSVAGATILVGADSAAYVFRRSGSAWVEEAKLLAPGYSVDIDAGGSALIGNPGEPVRVFRAVGSSWVQTQQLEPADGGAAASAFGWSVSLAGSEAIVGAFGADGFLGSAYLYHFDGTSWIQVRELNAADRQPDIQSQFGISVATDGTSAIVGAPGLNPGSAYVFRLATNGCSAVPACANGLDDDGDGVADLLDLGCADGSDLSERSAIRPCDDGLDNDGDGFADFPADPGCKDGAWSTESPKCQDGLNNDGKAGTDYDAGVSILGAGNGDPEGADPQCVGKPWRKKEDIDCGSGAELAFVTPIAIAIARRRRAATAQIRS